MAYKMELGAAKLGIGDVNRWLQSLWSFYTKLKPDREIYLSYHRGRSNPKFEGY
jgi:hypothetical protein